MGKIIVIMICVASVLAFVYWFRKYSSKKITTVDEQKLNDKNEISTIHDSIDENADAVGVNATNKEKSEIDLKKVENPDKNKPFAKISSPSEFEKKEYENANGQSENPEQIKRPKRKYNKHNGSYKKIQDASVDVKKNDIKK